MLKKGYVEVLSGLRPLTTSTIYLIFPLKTVESKILIHRYSVDKVS
jgi:hypothetical protein